MLEWASVLIATYAPAWEALGATILLRLDRLVAAAKRCSRGRTAATNAPSPLDPSRMMARVNLLQIAWNAGNWDAPTMRRPTWCSAVRRVPTPTSRSATCCVTQECSSRLHTGVQHGARTRS